jgi:hypothetical protein
MIRFTRLRAAAPPADRTDTARPRRGPPSLPRLASTVNIESEDLTGRQKTRSKSAFDSRRRLAPNRDELSSEMAGPVLGLGKLRREPGPALRAATGKDLATFLRSHPCPEAMITLTAQIARLEGALHCSALKSWLGTSAVCRPGEKGRES